MKCLAVHGPAQKRQRNRQRAARLYDSIVPARVEGLKRASFVAVGEKHSIALQVFAASLSLKI